MSTELRPLSRVVSFEVVESKYAKPGQGSAYLTLKCGCVRRLKTSEFFRRNRANPRLSMRCVGDHP